MGRRKIEIQPITHERNRTVTFSKRKNGLFKKAYELGVLCSVQVAVIIFEERQGHGVRLHQYGSKDVGEIVNRHITFVGEKDTQGPADFSNEVIGKTEDVDAGDDDGDGEVKSADDGVQPGTNFPPIGLDIHVASPPSFSSHLPLTHLRLQHQQQHLLPTLLPGPHPPPTLTHPISNDRDHPHLHSHPYSQSHPTHHPAPALPYYPLAPHPYLSPYSYIPPNMAHPFHREFPTSFHPYLPQPAGPVTPLHPYGHQVQNTIAPELLAALLGSEGVSVGSGGEEVGIHWPIHSREGDNQAVIDDEDNKNWFDFLDSGGNTAAAAGSTGKGRENERDHVRNGKKRQRTCSDAEPESSSDVVGLWTAL